MDEEAVRRIVSDAVQAAVTQIAAAATAPAAEAGNPPIDTPPPTPTSSTTPRWNPNEVEFFDPQYDGKTIHSGATPIEHAGKDTFFRDVHLFIERAKQFVLTKGDIVRENLWLSLRGSALS